MVVTWEAGVLLLINRGRRLVVDSVVAEGAVVEEEIAVVVLVEGAVVVEEEMVAVVVLVVEGAVAEEEMEVVDTNLVSLTHQVLINLILISCFLILDT